MLSQRRGVKRTVDLLPTYTAKQKTRALAATVISIRLLRLSSKQASLWMFLKSPSTRIYTKRRDLKVFIGGDVEAALLIVGETCPRKRCEPDESEWQNAFLAPNMYPKVVLDDPRQQENKLSCQDFPEDVRVSTASGRRAQT